VVAVIEALRHLLTAPLEGNDAEDLRGHFARVDPLLRSFGTDSAAAAIAAGFEAPGVGLAFAGGYRAALGRLVPDLGPVPRACLCATEKGGAHPRAIATRLVAAGAARSEGAALPALPAGAALAAGAARSPDSRAGGAAGAAAGSAFSLAGTKTFATLACESDELLVVASAGEKDGRNQLRIVRLPRSRAGIRITPRATTPFAPEIGHAVVTFDQVAVAANEVLEGDGYARYLKPFRTIEDIHVLAALLAYVVRIARVSGWQPTTLEGFLVPLVAVHALSNAPTDAAETHLALGALFSDARALIAAIPEDEWRRCETNLRARWERDRALLEVAEGARAQRLATARATVISAAAARRSSPQE
jgi:hypothetical protein